MRVPSELYTPSLRPYRGLTDLAYPFHEGTAVVTHCSRLCFDRRKVNLSQVFAGQQVGVRQGESVTHVLGIIRYPCFRNHTRRSGGEGGIRTLSGPLDSVSYRFHNADIAADASVAVAPCTLLHARPKFRFRLGVARASR